MIFSIVEKVSEQEKVHKIMIKGSNEGIAAELVNIVKELLKRGFPEDLLIAVLIDVIGDSRE